MRLLHYGNMHFQWFIDLGALARTGNFTQAAGLTNISQPAFSRRIKALESWVGTPMVDRSKHPVRLTEAGEQMLEAGYQAIERIEMERANVLEALTQPDRYVVKFAAQHSISWRFFPAWLQAFESTYGAILSRLRADDLPNCIEDLKRGEVDFVISYESGLQPSVDEDRDLTSLTIGRDLLIPVCKPKADGSPIFNLDDDSALPLPFLRFGSTAPIGWHIEPLLEARGLKSRLQTVYENTMAGALRIRARDGMGVSWLPATLVQPDIDSKLLTHAGSGDWAINVDIRIHRLHPTHNALIRSIWDFLSLRESIPVA
jgi:DNA-binding transcriptional LysR family regulator